MRCVIGFCTRKWCSIRTRFNYVTVLECNWLCYPSKWLRCLTCPSSCVQHRTQDFRIWICLSSGERAREGTCRSDRYYQWLKKMKWTCTRHEGGWSAVEIQIQSLYLEIGWQSSASCLGRFTLGNRHPLIRRLGGPHSQSVRNGYEINLLSLPLPGIELTRYIRSSHPVFLFQYETTDSPETQRSYQYDVTVRPLQNSIQLV
jgi:hypothetical protein